MSITTIRTKPASADEIKARLQSLIGQGGDPRPYFGSLARALKVDRSAVEAAYAEMGAPTRTVSAETVAQERLAAHIVGPDHAES